MVVSRGGKNAQARLWARASPRIPSEVLGSARWGLFETYRQFRDLLRREKPRAILIYGYYQKEHWILRFLAQQFRIPLLFVGENFSDRARGLRGWLREPLLSLFFAGISRFIAIGKRTFDY